MAKPVMDRMGKLLVDADLVSEDQLTQAIEEQDGKSLPQSLVALGFVSENQIASTLADSMNVPFVDLGNYEVDPNAATKLSADMANKYRVLPIGFSDDELVVAMADPANIFALDDLRIVTGCAIKPVVATESDLMEAIRKFTRLDESVEDMVDAVSVEDEEEATTAKETEDEAGTGPQASDQ